MTVNLISIAMFYTTQLVGHTATNRHPVHMMCNNLLNQMKPMFSHKYVETEDALLAEYNARMMVREMAKMRRTLRGTCDIFDIPYKSVSVQSFANRVKPFEI